MQAHQIISHKSMGHYELYRIHDIMDGVLVNVRAVKQYGDYFTVAIYLNEEENKFIFSDEDIHMYEGLHAESVKQALEEQTKNIEQNISQIMKVTANTNVESVDVRTVGGHTFVITEDDRDIGIPRIQTAYGESDGRITYYGEIPQQQDIEFLVANLIEEEYADRILRDEERSYDDDVNQFFQISASEYIAIVDEVLVPLFLYQDEEGNVGFVGDINHFRYYKNTEHGISLDMEPDNVYYNDEVAANKFLEQVIKELKNRLRTTN